MRIDHSSAITLEWIVRKVHTCDRAGMGGYIDADHFESEPFDAALIALAPLWKKTKPMKLKSSFINGNIYYAANQTNTQM